MGSLRSIRPSSSPMPILRLYTRVLELLGKEARLGWLLAVVNLLLAASQFAEPVLFGRIVDVLSGKTVAGSSSAWPFLAAWVAFGLFTIVFTALTTFVVRRTFGMQMAVEEQYSELSARASDALGNVALVQSFVRVESEVKGLRSVADELLAAQMPVLSWWALVTVITRASTTITVLAIFTFGIALHDQGLTSVGEIVMFVSFATLLIQKLEQVVSFINNVFMEAPRLREFFNVLDAVPAVHDRHDAIDAGRLSGLVEFNDVTFSYDGKRPAVEDLSFTALPGQTIALVGATGAGKSTAIALLHRAFDPQSGFIKIDGMDVRGLTLTALRRNIGVVFQEALLFDRSIADNLRVGKPDATDEELRVAAARAQALEFIERGDKKFETNAGERGRMLSGGERQRLSIARAIL